MERPTNNEEVYCHICSHRWRRSEHGLECPRCGSDFVEIVDPDNDPAADFDESEDENFDTHSPSDNPFGFPFPPRGNNGPGPNVVSPFGGLFGWMSQQNPGTSMPQSNNGNPGTRTWMFQSPTGTTRLTATTSFSVGGARSPGSPSNLPQAQALEHVLSEIMGGQVPLRSPGLQGGPGGPGRPPDAILGLMNVLLGPPTGRMGDVAWSQEEFDRIITQLMEQNSGTAPGPASADAISSLPKKTVDSSMVGESGKAECTICMDDVQIGDVVTELYCKHWFHTNCITVWLNEHNTCPHCRMGIEEAKQKAEEEEGGGKGDSGKDGKKTFGSGGNNSPGPSGGGSGSSRPGWLGEGPSANTRSRSNNPFARNFGLYDQYRPPTPPTPPSNRTNRPRRSMRLNSDSNTTQSPRNRHIMSRSPSATASGPATPLSVPESNTDNSNDARAEALRASMSRAERQRRRHSSQSGDGMYPNYREEYRPPTPPMGRRSSRRNSSYGASESRPNLDRWDRDAEFGDLIDRRANRSRSTREGDHGRRTEREREGQKKRTRDRERERDVSHPSRSRRTENHDGATRRRRSSQHDSADARNSNAMGNHSQQSGMVGGVRDRVRSWFGSRS